jgi:diguanylate cyclase (GGDEF)-like protein/PAS domain S-box-containing protein
MSPIASHSRTHRLRQWAGRRFALRLGIIPLVLLFCAILIALDVTYIWRLRARDLAEAAKETANLAQSLGQQAEDTVRTADLTLIGAAQRLEIDGTGPDTLEKLRQIMMARLVAFPALANFVVTDAAGKCLMINLPVIPGDCSLASAPNYEFHRTHEDQGPHLSAPKRPIGSDAWMIPLSRRFNHPDGSFAGIVVTGVSISYFTRYYDTFKIGENGSIALALADGTLLVRRPSVDLDVARNLKNRTVSRGPLADASIAVSQIKSSIDGVVRLTSYRRMEAYPLFIAVGASMDDILASWRATLWSSLGLTAGLIALVGFMGVRLTAQNGERDAIEKLRVADLERFQFIFESVSDGINVMDANTGTFTDANPASCTMFGYSRDELIGHTIEFLSTGISPYTQRDAIASLAKGLGEPQTIEWHCKAKDGHLFWTEISFRNVALEDRNVGLAILRDITVRKRRHDEVIREANIDVLTDLPNRRAFDDVLQQEIARSRRYDRPLCAAIGDIDHFKSINDTFGHQVGDAVLEKLAAFMHKSLRTADYLARWGGEEFAILLPETRLDAAEELLNRLRTDIASYVIPEIGRAVTLSFGVTACTKPDDAADLLERADRALYTSKQTGRDRVTKLRRSALEVHSTPDS